jgi:hypothetical protein
MAGIQNVFVFLYTKFIECMSGTERGLVYLECADHQLVWCSLLIEECTLQNGSQLRELSE